MGARFMSLSNGGSGRAWVTRLGSLGPTAREGVWFMSLGDGRSSEVWVLESTSEEVLGLYTPEVEDSAWPV